MLGAPISELVPQARPQTRLRLQRSCSWHRRFNCQPKRKDWVRFLPATEAIALSKFGRNDSGSVHDRRAYCPTSATALSPSSSTRPGSWPERGPCTKGIFPAGMGDARVQTNLSALITTQGPALAASGAMCSRSHPAKLEEPAPLRASTRRDEAGDERGGAEVRQGGVASEERGADLLSYSLVAAPLLYLLWAQEAVKQIVVAPASGPPARSA